LFTLGPDFTVHIESCMTPVQYLYYKVLVDQLFAEEQKEDLACEKPAEKSIIETCELMEPSFFIGSSLCDEVLFTRGG